MTVATLALDPSACDLAAGFAALGPLGQVVAAQEVEAYLMDQLRVDKASIEVSQPAMLLSRPSRSPNYPDGHAPHHAPEDLR